MKQTERKIVRRFVAAGFLVPFLLIFVILVGDIKLGGSFIWLLLIPWPTAPLLMTAEAGGGEGGQLLAFLISAVANVFVYGIVGLLVCAVYRLFTFRTE